MKPALLLLLSLLFACVGSGDGQVSGELHVLSCRDNRDLNDPRWNMKASFFAAEPIEDVDRGSPENRLEIRIQRDGAHLEESDSLVISIPDVRKAAAEWLRRREGSADGSAALEVRSDGLVRASLSLFATCPMAIETLNADVGSQIVFSHFGDADRYVLDEAASLRTGKKILPKEFIVDFGARLATRGGTSGFVLELADLRSRTLGEPAHASGHLVGSFDFEVRRGAAGQSFP